MCDRLHFMKDGRTLLVIWQKTEGTEHRLVLNFSLWDAPDLVQTKSFDIIVEAKMEHGYTYLHPDRINMFVERFSASPDERFVLMEIKKASDSHVEYEYVMVDLVSGRSMAPLPHKIMRLGLELYGLTLFSNRLQFTGAGTRIAYIRDPSTVAVTSLQEGEEEVEIRGDFNIPADVVISPDGLFMAVAVGEEREEVFVYELDWEMRYDGRAI